MAFLLACPVKTWILWFIYIDVSIALGTSKEDKQAYLFTKVQGFIAFVYVHYIINSEASRESIGYMVLGREQLFEYEAYLLSLQTDVSNQPLLEPGSTRWLV